MISDDLENDTQNQNTSNLEMITSAPEQELQEQKEDLEGGTTSFLKETNRDNDSVNISLAKAGGINRNFKL